MRIHCSKLNVLNSVKAEKNDEKFYTQRSTGSEILKMIFFFKRYFMTKYT